MKELPLICIIGSTGVGKTSFSYALAQHINNKAIIINGDMAQLYSGLSIGTAKPDLTNTLQPHYLFNHCTSPTTYNVASYRKDVQSIIAQSNDYPIVVGGSTLYMHSLFFEYCPWQPLDPQIVLSIESIAQEHLWPTLHQHDPARAAQLHPNDSYRLKRALMIIYAGKKASLQKPFFNPLRPTVLIHLTCDKEMLKTRLAHRLDIMLNNGWLQEVESLLDTEWENFWDNKKIIGYSDVASFIRKQKTMDQLKESIFKQTMSYAKKQEKYWRMLKRSIQQHDQKMVIEYTLDLTSNSFDQIIKSIKEVV